MQHDRSQHHRSQECTRQASRACIQTAADPKLEDHSLMHLHAETRLKSGTSSRADETASGMHDEYVQCIDQAGRDLEILLRTHILDIGILQRTLSDTFDTFG
ncbi:hypothetical protein [Oleiagrimonas sp.]|jgi:hypothetical protein|uniref:hypothetical protein n=1 Tax=Oleiagrimonas sp. TaxID=2010330 RepID=UPI0026026642|nr:hypothetical protein [Oleiagrimonas sp.]MDA3914105.1 hypothetical protein [Oleiagrimonas sp.]